MATQTETTVAGPVRARPIAPPEPFLTLAPTRPAPFIGPMPSQGRPITPDSQAGAAAAVAEAKQAVAVARAVAVAPREWLADQDDPSLLAPSRAAVNRSQAFGLLLDDTATPSAPKRVGGTPPSFGLSLFYKRPRIG